MGGTPSDTAAVLDALGRLVGVLRDRQCELVDEGVRAIRAEIAAYGRIDDEAFIADLRGHVELHHDGLLRSLERRRPLRRDELSFVSPRAARRVGRIGLADFMHAFRVYESVFWQALLEAATDDRERLEALSVVGIVMRYMNIAATEAAETYIEAERLLHAQGERVRRDLLEDLLARRPAAPGPKLAAARDAGLDPPRPCVLIAAVALGAPGDEGLLRSAASALSRAVAAAKQPLTVVRQDEVVVVAPVTADPSALVESVSAAHARLERDGVPLAIGISAVHDDLSRMDAAYAEASAALERVRGRGGVLALPSLTVFDCLALFGHETASRRVPEAVRSFVASDQSEGGYLVATFLEYLAADFNVRVMAERLHVHPNTARYRLGKIEERTRCDLRRFSDVLELLIAVRVAGP